jgi:hypothetical protein
MKRRAFVVVLGTSVLAAVAGARAQTSPRGGPGMWGPQAEKEFHLGRGMGPKLRTLNPTERDTYRREMHEKMVARAKERGMEMPAMPGRGAKRGGPPVK